MDEGKNKDLDENKDGDKNKKILKMENLFLFFGSIFPIFVSLLISIFNNNLLPFSRIYFTKCLSIVKQNMGYYGTVFGVYFAVKKYYEDKNQRDKELIEIQKQSNLLREKEIENRKDNYRPTFIIYNNKIELLMRKDDLFLENIVYYPCLDGTYDKHGKYIGNKRSGEYIFEGTEEEAIPDNFYISADTLLGEKILFGFLYAEHKVYKYLNDGGNPSLPNGFSERDYSLEVINQNWGSYNVVSNTYSYEKEELLYINIEKLFFYNSMHIRNIVFFNNNILKRRILISTNHQKLYKSIFFGLMKVKFSFYMINYSWIIKVLNEVYNQVYDKSDSFKIVNNTISLYKSDVERIIENFCTEFQDKQLLTLIKKIKDFFKKNDELEIKKSSIKYILDCIIEVIYISVKMPVDSNEKYRIIYFCITILHLLFENIEEVKEKSDSLNKYFLQDKSNILGAISFWIHIELRI